jgi:[ribosomal protein S5]-alanine N-acetyltransferase
MIIQTPRLILRDLEPSDSENLMQLSSDPEVVKYMDYIQFKTKEDADKWISEHIVDNNLDPRPSYSFAITLPETNEFVGWIGIGDASDKTKGDLDFGYAIAKKHWGKGYTTEALAKVIKIGFAKMHAKKIFGQCNVENQASIAVMKKVGMRFETEFFEDGNKSARYVIFNHNPN